jgi:hypothetical protein
MFLGRSLGNTKMKKHTRLRSDEFKENRHSRTGCTVGNKSAWVT